MEQVFLIKNEDIKEVQSSANTLKQFPRIICTPTRKNETHWFFTVQGHENELEPFINELTNICSVFNA